MKLDSFFSPRSIGIIGASRDPQKIGFGILRNLIEGKYTGQIYPINPNADQILNLKCYRIINEVENKPELCVVSVPSNLVFEVMKEAAETNIKNFVVISAGFKEIGPEGKLLEDKLEELAHDFNLNILGPNCLGFINTHDSINISFANSTPNKGKIAFASQSGALCTALLDWSNKTKLGFSHFVSLGNKMNINEIDLLNLWEEDRNTTSIAMYLESIEEGRNFIHVAQRISLKKPIIIITPGESSEAKKAISSHTGSIAGESKIMQTAFKQAGIIQAHNLEELFDFMSVFEEGNYPAGRKIAVISNAGGPSILATDEIMRQGMEMAPLKIETTLKLKEKLPRLINIRDPLDLIGDALASRYEDGITEILKEDLVDAVLVLLTPQIMTEIEETASCIVKLSKKYKKPIYAAFMGGTNVEKGIKILNENKIPNFYFPERAISAISQVVRYQGWKNKNQGKTFFIKTEKFNTQAKDMQKYHEAFRKSKNEKSGFIEDKVAFETLSDFHFPIPHFGFANNSAGVATMARFIGLPVVLKISSPEMPHRSDMGGVKINLNDFEQIGKASLELENIAHNSKLEHWSFLIQKMITDNEYEIILGAKKDRSFGHVIVFGSGGIYTEIYQDTSMRLINLDKNDAEQMIQETKIFKLFQGARGRKQLDTKPITDLIIKLSDFISLFPEITELDFNPIIVSEKSISIADAKIRL